MGLLSSAFTDGTVLDITLPTPGNTYDPLQLTSLMHLDYYALVYITLTLTISIYIIPFTFHYMKPEEGSPRFYVLLVGFV